METTATLKIDVPRSCAQISSVPVLVINVSPMLASSTTAKSEKISPRDGTGSGVGTGSWRGISVSASDSPHFPQNARGCAPLAFSLESARFELLKQANAHNLASGGISDPTALGARSPNERAIVSATSQTHSARRSIGRLAR